MDEQVRQYVEQYPSGIADMYQALRTLILDSAPAPLQEKLWARLPSYYAGEAFVRLIPFKDHINIEASAAAAHRQALTGYKRRPRACCRSSWDRIFPATRSGRYLRIHCTKGEKENGSQVV